MTQHDYAIANQTFPATRSDLNNVLTAIQTLNSGTTAPSTTAAGLVYYNTTDGWVYQRNSADSGWLKKWRIASNGLISQSGAEVYAASSTGNDAYEVTLDPAPTAYATGMMFAIKPDTANTGACTINANGLGAKNIKKNQTDDLETGDILDNQMLVIIYDGSAFQVVSRLSDNVTDTIRASIINDATAETTANDADTILIYDNSASAPRQMTRANFLDGVGGSGGLVYIQGATASTSASLDLDASLSSTYNVYKLVGSGLVPATNDTGIQIRFGRSATYVTSAGAYDWAVDVDGAGQASAADTSIHTYNSTATTMVSNAAGNCANFVAYIFMPSNGSLFTYVRGEATWTDGNTGRVRVWSFAGTINDATTAVTDVQILMSSGNITSGDLKIYGVVNS